jgi:hypothetical protein
MLDYLSRLADSLERIADSLERIADVKKEPPYPWLMKYDDNMQGCLDGFDATGYCGYDCGEFTIRHRENVIEVKYNDDNAGGGGCVHPDAYFIVKCNGVEVINDAHVEDGMVEIISKVISERCK